MLNAKSLEIDPLSVERKVVDFISTQIAEAGSEGAVISVSGGVDSAVALALLAKALSSDKISAITMPEQGVTPKSDITDALEVARLCGVTCDIIDITPMIQAIFSSLSSYVRSDVVSAGNVKARVRMIVNYYYANRFHRMVIGTSNKSELLTGYFTKYGDGAADLLPLGDLYKTQLYQLAHHLSLPRRIVEKAPSARLWPGQTTEGELGVRYEVLDLILYGWEQGMSGESIAKDLNVDTSVVIGVLERVARNAHKRAFPIILRQGLTSI